MKIILDTNIYRNLVRSLDEESVDQLSKDLIIKANEVGVDILFPIDCAMELISHYNDDIESERTECRNALKLLVAVSSRFCSNSVSVDNIAPPINLVLEAYFSGKRNLGVYSTVIHLAQELVGNIATHPDKVLDDQIHAVKSQIEFEKKGIKDNYEKLLKSMNGGVLDWSYFKDKKKSRKKFFDSLEIGKLSFLVSQSLVNRAYNIVGKEIILDEVYDQVVIKFIQDFAPAILMNEFLLEQVGHSTIALESVRDRRWNTIIDISLIFSALFNPDKKEMKLVTEENNIHESYISCGFQDKIMRLTEFKTALNL